MTTRHDDWYDGFWSNIEPAEDDQVSAVRLIGEMFADGLVWRDGDHIVGRGGNQTFLTSSDQFLIRRIEEAAASAQAESDPT